MTPPRLHKVEKKESKIMSFLKSRLYIYIYTTLYIAIFIFLMILFLAICFAIKGPTYGWFGS